MAEQDATAVAITGGTINNTTIGATTATTGKFTSVTTPSVTATTTDLTLSAISTGVVNLNTLNGTGLRLSELTGGTVNTGFGIFSGTSSQNTVYTVPYGTFANSNMYLASKGSGNLFLGTNSNNSSVATTQTLISHTASAVNYVQATGGATTAAPVISSQGSDGNIALSFVSKGTARHNFFNNGATSSRQFAVGTSGITSAVNFLNVDGSVAGIALPMQAQGSDTNISMAFQPKGTGAIDLAAGSSGVNISNGGTVTAITRTNAGVGYTTAPTWSASAPTTAGGVTATGTTALLLYSPVINAGGTGYTVGNTLTLVGGTFTSAAQLTVTAVSSGVITAVSILGGGGYSATPTYPASVTGGSGSGATFTLSAGIATLAIGTAGSGYIEQPTVTFSGGGGSGAAAYATVGGVSVIRALGNSNPGNIADSIQFRTPSGTAFSIQERTTNTANYLSAIANPAGSPPILRAAGSDGNIGINVGSVGTSAITFSTNTSGSNIQMQVSHTASAVNYVQVTGAATANPPVISAQGSDSTIAMIFQAKGGQDHRFFSNSGSAEQFRVLHTAGTMVNQTTATGSATGVAPIFGVRGTDTNIDLALTPKGTGLVRFGTYVAGALLATGYINIKAADGTTYKVLVST
jgi:hypothetical protein